MTEPVFDRELAERVLAKIASLPEVDLDDDVDVDDGVDGLEWWDQTAWIREVYNANGVVCGTACCFAGWTLVDGLEAGRIENDAGSVRAAMAADVRVWKFPDGTVMGGWLAPAARLLGIDPDSAKQLFRATNTREQLRAIVDALGAGVRGYALAEVRREA